MGRFLRVLTVFIFLFSIAALTMGILLFNRREILKGRTQKLETAVRNFVKTLEAEEPPEPEPVPQYPARDESEVSANAVPDPLRSDFWNRYNHALEEGSSDFVEIDSQARLRQLMSYYRWNHIENKPWKDPLTGQKATSGEGTMQDLLDEVQRKAEAQLARLLRTRAELIKTRNELVSTVTELNGHKANLRDRLAEIVRLNAEIARLNGEIRRKDMEIEELKNTIRSLELNIQDLEQEQTRLEEALEDQQIRNERLVQRIAELQDALDTERGRGRAVDVTEFERTGRMVLSTVRLSIEAGIKGRVVSVNEHHGFVVMEFTNEFMEELQKQLQTEDHIPAVSLNVQRGEGDDAQFIAKVRMVQVREHELLAIGTILKNWQQEPIKVGDTIFYQ